MWCMFGDYNFNRLYAFCDRWFIQHCVCVCVCVHVCVCVCACMHVHVTPGQEFTTQYSVIVHMHEYHASYYKHIIELSGLWTT